MKKITDEQWLTQCTIEANCQHNDGYTMQWYANEVKKAKQRIINKRDNKILGMKALNINGLTVLFDE
jgi:hypothetical protein